MERTHYVVTLTQYIISKHRLVVVPAVAIVAQKTKNNKEANAEEEPTRERDAAKLKREEVAETEEEELADNAIKQNPRIFIIIYSK